MDRHGREPRLGRSVAEVAVVVRAPAEDGIRSGDATRVPGPCGNASERLTAHHRHRNGTVVDGAIAERTEIVPPAVARAGIGHATYGLPTGGEAAERQVADYRHGSQASQERAVTHRSEEVVTPAVRLAIAR